MFHYSLIFVVSGFGYLIFASILPSNEKVWCNNKSSIYLIALFSLISILQFTLGVYLFEYQDAQLSVSALLRNSSLVFAAIICHFAYLKPEYIPVKKIDRFVLVGIGFFILASWFFVGAPRSSATWITAFSIWGFVSIWIGFNRSITEILTYSMTRKSNRFSMNLGLGVCLIAFGFFAICALRFSSNFSQLDTSMNSIGSLSAIGWSSLIAVALIIPIAQGFRFTALEYLNDVVGKKGISIWMFLFTSVVLGYIFYGESLESFKICGLVFGLIAVTFLDTELFTWVARSLRGRFLANPDTKQ